MLKPALITDCGRMQTTKGRASRWGRRGWEGPGDPLVDPNSLAGTGPRTEVPSTQGGWHEGPDHHTWGARGPGISRTLPARQGGVKLTVVWPTTPRAGGLQEDERETRGLHLGGTAGVMIPIPGSLEGLPGALGRSRENRGERQPGAGSPAAGAFGKRDPGPCPP